MEIFGKLLQQHAGGLVSQLVERLGFTPQSAKKFVPAVVNQITSALGGGGLDLESLAGNADLSALLGKMDFASLAQAAGIGDEQARDGVKAIAPDILDLIKGQAGGAGQLLGALGGETGGGLLGAAGKLAGGLFNKG